MPNKFNPSKDRPLTKEASPIKEITLYVLLLIVLFLYIYSIFFYQSTSDRGYWENIEMAFSMIKTFGIIAQVAIISLIYQLFYLTRHFIKKHKSKMIKNNQKEDELI